MKKCIFHLLRLILCQEWNVNHGQKDYRSHHTPSSCLIFLQEEGEINIDKQHINKKTQAFHTSLLTAVNARLAIVQKERKPEPRCRTRRTPPQWVFFRKKFWEFLAYFWLLILPFFYPKMWISKNHFVFLITHPQTSHKPKIVMIHKQMHPVLREHWFY